jgi:hypothetical protein
MHVGHHSALPKEEMLEFHARKPSDLRIFWVVGNRWETVLAVSC